MSRYRLQVVDESGVVVVLPAGGALEVALVERFAEAITARGVATLIGDALSRQRFRDTVVALVLAQGVGLWTTEAKVKQALEASLATVLAAFDADTEREISSIVREAVQTVVQGLKRKVVQVV